MPIASVWNPMESLKFLMVSTHYPPAHLGGDARFVEYLSDELVRRGHEVHVLHSPAAYAVQRKTMPVLDRVTPGGVSRHTYIGGFKRMDPLFSLVLGRGLGSNSDFGEIARKLKPDVTHWHNTKGFIGRPVASDSGESLYTAHDFYAVCPRSNLLRPGGRLCERPLLCQTCLLRWRKPPQLWRVLWMRVVRPPEGFTVLSPSEFVAGRLRREGIRVDHVLRNFVPDRGTIPSRGSEANRIVFLGVLESFKGPMTLLEAFGRCKDEQGFELSFFGEGSLKEPLKNRVRALSLEDRVHVRGFVPLDDLREHLEETAAIIVPSESYENAPLVALEALSMGIPVIGSSIGGLPEILQPDSGSTLFTPGDAGLLSREMVALWNERGALAERRRKARAAYEKGLSPDAHLREYLEIVRARV